MGPSIYKACASAEIKARDTEHNWRVYQSDILGWYNTYSYNVSLYMENTLTSVSSFNVINLAIVSSL